MAGVDATVGLGGHVGGKGDTTEHPKGESNEEDAAAARANSATWRRENLEQRIPTVEGFRERPQKRRTRGKWNAAKKRPKIKLK